MAVRECCLITAALNGWLRSIAYDYEARAGQIGLTPGTVAYDKASCSASGIAGALCGSRRYPTTSPMTAATKA
jgi:hypothetical protein